MDSGARIFVREMQRSFARSRAQRKALVRIPAEDLPGAVNASQRKRRRWRERELQKAWNAAHPRWRLRVP
jgi:hypothetical protein